MRPHRTPLALALVVALPACTAARDECRDVTVEAPAPAAVPGPMAGFARMIPGAWQVTFASGERGIDTWDWGPGKHSVRAGALEVFYWHPGRGQVCMLSLHPDIPGVGRGVGEGTIRFDGDLAEGVFDLYQPPGLRKMGLRWSFAGPDEYRDTLLEESGAGGLGTLAEWVRVRVPRPTETPPHEVREAPTTSEHLKAFRPLLGGAWEALGDAAGGSAAPLRATFAWIPDYVHAQVHAPGQDGDGASTHLLDAYVYEHVGTGALRCLALSHRGGVVEGDVTVLEGGALQLDLEAHERDRVDRLVVRLDLEDGATLRQRAWSVAGAERTPLFDVRLRRLAAEGPAESSGQQPSHGREGG